MRAPIGKTVRPAAILGFALAACLGLLGSSRQARAESDGVRAGAAQPAGKIERAVLEDTAGGKSASFVVLMAQQANVNAAYAMRDQDARGWYGGTCTTRSGPTRTGARQRSKPCSMRAGSSTPPIGQPACS